MQEGGEQGIGMLFAMLRYDELTTPLVQRSTSGAWLKREVVVKRNYSHD